MNNKQEIQRHIDRRLSGLNASAIRRARIRAAAEKEKQGNSAMRRGKTVVLMAAAAITVTLATIVIAESLNLFHLFGSNDARYENVAEQAALATALPQTIFDEQLGPISASIDSAYWDGLTLNVAFQIEQGIKYEIFTPDKETLRSMAPADPLPVAIDEKDPGSDVLTAYNNALKTGTPFGYRKYSVVAGDHTVTDDGIDIPPYTGDSRYTQDGTYREMREFETPLPAELSCRERLNLSIKLYKQQSTFYFDGKQCYASHSTMEAGSLSATVPLTKGAARSMEGQGVIGGVSCKATARVSRMAASVTVTAEAPFKAFLPEPPKNVAPSDRWTELAMLDEKGRFYRAQSAFDDSGTEGTIAFLGTGELPEKLTLYLYTTWESADAPDYAKMDGITLTVRKER